MCTAIIRHCVVSNGTNVGGMQQVDGWTVNVDSHGRAKYG